MKWPPEIGPNIKMMAKRPVAVAAAFSKSWRPTLPGERFCAAMPEPMTMAARKALPRNSASSRRHKTVSLTGTCPRSPVVAQQQGEQDCGEPTATGTLPTASGTQHDPSPAIPVSAGASARTV